MEISKSLISVMYVPKYDKYAPSILRLIICTQIQLLGLTLVKPSPMRSILSLYFFSFVFIATCLTLGPDVLLTDQVSPSNNLGSSSHEYDLSGQGLSDMADANNDACTSDAGATGNVVERRNLVGRGKICVPPVQQNKPANVQPAPPPSPRPQQPSKINPDLPGHLDNLPESYPLLHLKPNELNLDEEICSPTMTAERRYAYCDSGFILDRIIRDRSEPRSWDLLRCQDCTCFVI